MKRFWIIVAVLILAGGALWITLSEGPSASFVQQYIENGEILSLNARYSAKEILEAHRRELILDARHTVQEPILKLHPYLLMEVKYTLRDNKPREGVVLWSLLDGEMVINTDTWERTHGFEDALNAGASRNDFKLMYTLARGRGSLTMDQLQKELRLDKDAVQSWVAAAAAKHLVVKKGNVVQLHFQDPKLVVQPETRVNDWLVKKPFNASQRVVGRYSPSQIRKVAQAAFGDDFAIRNTVEVFLPVYSIDIVNPDGTILTTFWNAITGERIVSRFSL